MSDREFGGKLLPNTVETMDFELDDVFANSLVKKGTDDLSLPKGIKALISVSITLPLSNSS
jgi:hypothetical protein